MASTEARLDQGTSTCEAPHYTYGVDIKPIAQAVVQLLEASGRSGYGVAPKEGDSSTLVYSGPEIIGLAQASTSDLSTSAFKLAVMTSSLYNASLSACVSLVNGMRLERTDATNKIDDDDPRLIPIISALKYQLEQNLTLLVEGQTKDVVALDSDQVREHTKLILINLQPYIDEMPSLEFHT